MRKESKDAEFKEKISKSYLKTVSWYDNEMSYTAQLVRTLKYFVELAK